MSGAAGCARVCWRSKLTGAEGRGRPIPLQAAEDAAREANEHFADIEHWTEPAEYEEEAS